MADVVEVISNGLITDVVEIISHPVQVVEIASTTGPQGNAADPVQIALAVQAALTNDPTIVTDIVFYKHIQMTPSSVWTITHGLSYFPNVTIVDSAGTVVVGDIVYTSATVATVTFSSAFAGTAYLS